MSPTAVGLEHPNMYMSTCTITEDILVLVLYVCTYITQMYEHTDTQTHRHTDTQTHTHAQTYVCVCVHVCVVLSVTESLEYIHTYIRTYIHTYNTMNTQITVFLQKVQLMPQSSDAKTTDIMKCSWLTKQVSTTLNCILIYKCLR